MPKTPISLLKISNAIAKGYYVYPHATLEEWPPAYAGFNSPHVLLPLSFEKPVHV